MFKFTAKIIEGNKVGKSIGFPTANLDISALQKEFETLEYGVYACKLDFKEKFMGKSFLAAANYGARKTFDDEKIYFEAHILDFGEDVYGETVEVEVLEQIRGVKKFDEIEELKAQIENDVAKVRDLFPVPLK